MEILDKSIDLAQFGKDFFRYLQGRDYISDGEFSSKLFLVFCDDDEELHRHVLSYGSPFLQARQKEELVLCSTNEIYTQMTQNFADLDMGDLTVVDFVTLSHQELEGLISLYEMYQFSDQMIFISTTRPYGTKLEALLAQGQTKEDIVKHCIFGLQ